MSVCLQTFCYKSNQENPTEVFIGNYDSVRWVYLPTNLNVDFYERFCLCGKVCIGGRGASQ